jgi:hypothetical protein
VWYVEVSVSQRLPHQMPSFHQSLLSGLVPLAVPLEPKNEGPS